MNKLLAFFDSIGTSKNSLKSSIKDCFKHITIPLIYIVVLLLGGFTGSIINAIALKITLAEFLRSSIINVTIIILFGVVFSLVHKKVRHYLKESKMNERVFSQGNIIQKIKYERISAFNEMDVLNAEFFSILTKRERQVTILLLQGNTVPQVSVILGITVYTSKEHVKNIYKKLGIGSRSELFIKYSEVVS